MGVDLRPLAKPSEISFSDLKRKKLAVDAHLVLYQFLTTMPELRDSKGRLTSYLSGLFYRTTHLMSEGMKLAFAFDGFAGQPKTSMTVTEEIISESKKLLQLLGCPVIQALAEGEAQCAFMAKRGDVWATASQDYDSLLFGSPKLVRNLTISKYRKLPKGGKAKIYPEVIDLKLFLRQNKINQKQLISLGMIIGTDFNPKIPNIGPKNAVKLVRKKTPEQIFRKLKPNFDWKEAYKIITKMPTTKNYKLKWNKVDTAGIKRFLVEEHDFNVKRVESALDGVL